MNESAHRLTGVERFVFLVAGTSAFIYGVHHAISLKWACDDTFIVLRYVRHWIEGQGLVYNSGEFTEGYTNFLWVVLTGLGGKLGYDLLTWSLTLSIIFYAGVLLLCLFFAFRLGSPLPLTAAALAVHYDFNIWATGGLETMFYTFLLCLLFTMFYAVPFSLGAKLILSGVIMAVLLLTRPDAVIFILCINMMLFGFLWFQKPGRRVSLQCALYLNLPVAVSAIPYLWWKYSYYGDLLPNTFYAKTSGQLLVQQGLYYVYSYFKAYPSSLLWAGLLTLILWVYRHGKTRHERLLFYIYNDKFLRMLVSIAFTIFIYIFFFVIKVGGDFMFARFVVPLIPLFYLSLETGISALTTNFQSMQQKRTFIYTMACIGLVLFSFAEKHMRDEMLLGTETGKPRISQWHGITDERFFYTKVIPLDKMRQLGEDASPYFAGLPVRVLNIGDCCFTYYAGFDYVLENFGLTDKYIARLPSVTGAQRVGHHKSAPYEYIRKQGIHFCFDRKMYLDEDFRKVMFNIKGTPLPAEMFFYDKALLRELRMRFGRNFMYVDLDKHFSEFVEQTMPAMEKSAVRNIYQEFKEFYFDQNDDPATEYQEKKILEFLEAPDPEPGLPESSVPSSRGPGRKKP